MWINVKPIPMSDFSIGNVMCFYLHPSLIGETLASADEFICWQNKYMYVHICLHVHEYVGSLPPKRLKIWTQNLGI